MDYTVTLTETQQKAMEYIAADVNEWISNSAYARASIAIEEICKIYIEHKMNNNEAITVVGKDAMVLAAYEEGIVKSLSQVVAEQVLPE